MSGNLADGHLWLHFTRTADWLADGAAIPVIDHGRGCELWDVNGKRYLDGLSALFCCQIGYGRHELVEAASAQMSRLAFTTNWGFAHQPAIDLAEAVAARLPAGIDHVFFVNSGSEAVESALKLAQQFHRLNGEPDRVKVISRRYAYHGTTLGALGVTGISALREPFEPLRPVHLYAPNTNRYRPEVDDPAGAIEEQILDAGPESVSAVIVEPVQNAGGCLTPAEGYFQRLREICDRYGVLLVCDEVITGFGRLGTWTGSAYYDAAPDIITFAKGVTSGYVPLGGMAFHKRIGTAFREDGSSMFVHGATWGGHPVACAVGLANIAVMEADDVLGNVQRHAGWLAQKLEDLADRHEIVADVRGAGYFWALELAKDRDNKVRFSDEESEHLVRGILSPRLLELGLIGRADRRDEPVIQLSPPLIATQQELSEIVSILDQVLSEATKRMRQ